MENTQAAVTPEVKVEEPKTVEGQKPAEDLVSRVASFKPPAKEATPKTDEAFDYKEIEAIKDPAAKEVALKAYKSMQSGFGKKFQEVAELRKTLEAKASESANWTPERIQSLLNDPNFVKAAQQVTGTSASNQNQSGLSNEEWSALTDNEKAQLTAMQHKINMLESINSQTLKLQQDETLKAKFANYDPRAVDLLTADLLQGKVQATREHLHKVLDYEAAVERAYQLGLTDGTKGKQERLNASSFQGSSAINSSERPQPNKDESNIGFFQRVARQRLSDSLNKK
jgi:hypothetical protein